MNNNSKKIRVIIIAAAVALILGLAIALASHFWAEEPKEDETATTEALTNADGTCAHTYTKSVVEVTKETDGYALYTCSRCGAKYKNEYKYATGSEGLKFDNNHSGLKVVKSENCTDENIIIPEVVEGKKVMWIDGEAFYKNTTVKSIKILGKLDRIGFAAFAGCTSLTDIYYVGKKAEWEAMPKGDKWDADMPSYTVHCSDGDITK